MVDAVHHVADVMHKAGDLAELHVAAGHANAFEDIAGDARNDAGVTLAMLGIAHRFHDLVGAIDELFDFAVASNVFDRDRLGGDG